jgi:hypothetical protein
MIEWDTHISKGTGHGWRTIYEGRKAMAEKQMPALQAAVDQSWADWNVMQEHMKELQTKAEELRAETQTAG